MAHSSGQKSVKGTLVLGAVVTVRRLRDRGRISSDQLAARLSAPALSLIDEKIDLGRWYPLDVFCEILDTDWEVAGTRSTCERKEVAPPIASSSPGSISSCNSPSARNAPKPPTI